MNERILRLSAYRRTLSRLREAGLPRVTSEQIAAACGTTAAVVRKDFSAFRLAGRRRGGYGIDELVTGIERVLAADTPCPVILVGCGNLGAALVRYRGFRGEQLRIVAAFDSDPARQSPRGTPPVYAPERAAAVIRRHAATVAIIAVPDTAAQAALDALVGSGITGVLNFAPVHLRAPDGVFVRNVNLEIELENVIWASRTGAGCGITEEI